MDEEQMFLLGRVQTLFASAYDDLHEAEHTMGAFVQASYVLGRISELLDGQPSHVIQNAADDWNEAVAIFNRLGVRYGSAFKLARI